MSHVRKVHRIKPVKCTKCDVTVKNKNSLNRHMKVHQVGTCSECGGIFKVGSLKTHLLVHLEVKSHSCSCGSGFTRKESLTRHLKKCTVPLTLSPPSYNEINGVKSKYAEIRLKIIEEKKLKQENVRANITIWSRRK